MMNDIPMSNEDKITTPMVKYRVWFQHGAGTAAEKVFNRLDDKLRPRLFLLVVPEARGDEPTPVCLEPADECGYEPKFFSCVMDLAGQIEEKAASKTLGVRNLGEGQERKISAELFQKAVEQPLNESEKGSKFVSFCSPPTTVGRNKVCCILQFDAEAYRSHFSLPVKPPPGSVRAALLRRRRVGAAGDDEQ